MPSVWGVMSTRIGPTSMPGDQPALDGGAHGDGQVGLDLAVDGASQAFFQQAVNERGASRPAHQTTLSI